MKSLLLAAFVFAPFAQAQQRVSITDPTLNMIAWTGTIPNGWHFEGRVLRQGEGSAGQVTFRITSPDNQVTFQSYPAALLTERSIGVPGEIVSHRVSTQEILTRYIVPAIRPNAKVFTDPAGPKPPTSGPNGLLLEKADVTLHYNQDNRSYDETLIGITSLRSQGPYFSVTWLLSCSAPAGHLVEAAKFVAQFPVEVSQDWLRRDHEQLMAYFSRKSNAIAAQGNQAILAGAAAQRQNQDALFHASMANAAASQHAIDEGAQQTIDNIADRTRIYVWHNPSTGATVSTTTSYAPAGGPWISVQR